MRIQILFFLDILGTGSEYIFKEVEKISNISSEKTVTIQNIDNSTIIKTFDWSILYGKLGERKI